MDVAKFRKFADLDRQIKERDRELKRLKADRTELEKELTEEMAEEGVGSLKVPNGVRNVTLSLSRKLYATNIISPEATAAACKAAGLGEMVKEAVNANTLSAYLRDLERAEEAPPAEFEGVIGTFEKFSIGVTAS